MQFQNYIRRDLSKYDTNNEVKFAKKSSTRKKEKEKKRSVIIRLKYD